MKRLFKSPRESLGSTAKTRRGFPAKLIGYSAEELVFLVQLDSFNNELIITDSFGICKEHPQFSVVDSSSFETYWFVTYKSTVTQKRNVLPHCFDSKALAEQEADDKGLQNVLIFRKDFIDDI
jgi:hypothetical protein